MAGYDPKAKRTHSPAATDGPAPVDDLLGSTPAPEPAPEAPHAPEPIVTNPIPRPPGSSRGPEPRTIAVVAGVVVAAALLWRWRGHRRG